MTSARDILIVEDDEAIATGLSLNLRLAGHVATVARDGEEAITIISERDFDLVLLDLNLPRKNGLEVLASTREADNLVPVIVLDCSNPVIPPMFEKPDTAPDALLPVTPA